MFIRRICQLFADNGIPMAVVGGYAVAIHGVARGTFDVDIITEISEENFVRIESVLEGIGMKSILPVDARTLFKNLENYKLEKNLIAWNFIHPNRVRDSLDILITEDIRNYQTVLVSAETGEIPTVSLDGLIRMKAAAGREQDLEDVKALKKLRGNA
jgi:hypothetical protein